MSVLGDKATSWNCPELTIFLEYKPGYRDVVPSLSWISMLQGLTIQNHGDFSGKSFWWYEKTPADSTTGCHPLMPWLWTKPDKVGHQEYIKWGPVGPFFIDDRERRCRLITASSREREAQRNVITQVLTALTVNCENVRLDWEPTPHSFEVLLGKARLMAKSDGRLCSRDRNDVYVIIEVKPVNLLNGMEKTVRQMTLEMVAWISHRIPQSDTSFP